MREKITVINTKNTCSDDLTLCIMLHSYIVHEWEIKKEDVTLFWRGPVAVNKLRFLSSGLPHLLRVCLSFAMKEKVLTELAAELISSSDKPKCLWLIIQATIACIEFNGRLKY